MQIYCTSQAQPVVAVGAAGSKTGLHNKGNFSNGRTILRPTIHILPPLQYKVSIKTRL